MIRASSFVVVLMTAGVATARAAEFESEPRLFKFEEIKTVRGDTYTLPVTFTLISGVAENIGVVLSLSSNAEIALYLEGESNLHWPVLGTDSAVEQRITPVADSSFVGMRAGMSAAVNFTGTVIGNTFSFPLVTEDIEFADEVARFTPFLLPFQPDGVSYQLLQPEATSGKLSFPLSVPVINDPNSPVLLTVGATLRADPVSRAEIEGISLDTVVTDPTGFANTFSTDGSDMTAADVFVNVVELGDAAAELEANNQWVAEIGTSLGYLIGIDINISFEVFGVALTFDFNAWEQQLDIFPFLPEQQTFDASPDTAPYFHPLPVLALGGTEVPFVDVPVGEPATVAFPILNDGALELVGEAAIEGSDVFVVAPPTFAVSPGGSTGVNVTFTPPREGAFEGTLVLTSSDPTQPEVRVPIRGTAVVGTGGTGGLDNGDDEFGTPIDYITCGCASGGLTPSGLLPLVGVAGLVSLRRRRPA